MSCKHLDQWVNQGTWACGLYDENHIQKYPECNCTNCPDFEEIEIETTYTTNKENNIC